jgi:hypothetical protein
MATRWTRSKRLNSFFLLISYSLWSWYHLPVLQKWTDALEMNHGWLCIFLIWYFVEGQSSSKAAKRERVSNGARVLRVILGVIVYFYLRMCLIVQHRSAKKKKPKHWARINSRSIVIRDCLWQFHLSFTAYNFLSGLFWSNIDHLCIPKTRSGRVGRVNDLMGSTTPPLTRGQSARNVHLS